VCAQQREEAPLAYWLELTGIDRAWKRSVCEREVVVGVVDTGVSVHHPSLERNIWVNEFEVPNNGVDDDRNGYVDDINGFDFFLKRPQLTDPHGHGTHVAGIILWVVRRCSRQQQQQQQQQRQREKSSIFSRKKPRNKRKRSGSFQKTSRHF
ncbi:hypothetical protein, conserved, partial [Eimeria tenella]